MLNHITLIGRLTADPDYRATQSGVKLARFTLAVERDYTDQSGERQTDFFDVTVWRNKADFVSQYFRKGQLVAVSGEMQSEVYTDKEGVRRKSWKVQAQQVYFAEPKRDGSDRPQGGHNVDVPYSEGQPQAYQQPRQTYQQPQPTYEQQSLYSGGDSGYTPYRDYAADDDLPF